MTPLDESLAGDVGGWMRLAFWAVVIMVLSVCANVANLHLARSTRRLRELAIRLALGATRRHIVTSLLVESMLVSIAATAAALLIALWSVDAARAALPEAISRADEIAVNRRVLVGAAGVYGVITSTIAEERRDIGVRIALGSTAGRVTREVLSRTSRHLAISAAIGIPFAWWVTRGLASLLFEVQASDVSPYLIALAIVSASGLAAAWVPARRASRLDPLVALRAE